MNNLILNFLIFLILCLYFNEWKRYNRKHNSTKN